MDAYALAAGMFLLIIAAAWVRFARPRLTAQVTFAAAWVPLLIVQGVFTPLDVHLSPATALLIILAGASAFAGGLVALAILRFRAPGPDDAAEPQAPLSADSMRRLTVAHIALSAALLAYIGLQLAMMWPAVIQAGGITEMFTPGSGAAWRFKEILAARANSGAFFGGSLALSALSYLTYLGQASIYIGAILLRSGRFILASIPLILNAAFSMISLQRTSFVLACIQFLAAWALTFKFLPRSAASAGRTKRNPEKKPQRRSLSTRSRVLLGVLVALVAAAVVLVPVQLRNLNTHNPTGLQSVAQYLFSSLGGLDTRAVPAELTFRPPTLESGEPSAVPGMGAYTFTGAVGILAKLGVPLEEPPYTYDYQTIAIFGSPFSSNTATALYDFYLDGGFLFSVLIMLILGFASTLVQSASSRRRLLILMPISSFLLAAAFWSFFVGSLTRDTRNVGVALFGCLVMWWATREHGPSQIEPAPPQV